MGWSSEENVCLRLYLEILSRVKSEAIKVGIFLNERRAKKWKNNLK